MSPLSSPPQANEIHSSLLHRVGHVLGMRSTAEMIRIQARRIVATVDDLETLCALSGCLLPDKTVTVGLVEPTVASGRSAAEPKPAFSIAVDPRII